jgi:hypothetical protein|nr:hypothetical protein [uncultured Mediterranean phage uvMED]|tara:strand:+ start:476 stop:637 length:162 start_codon:yes stop_codon:yes gene_type:complete
MDQALLATLEEIYKGQTNVAVKAMEHDMTLQEMCQLFNEYVKERPFDIDSYKV